LNARSGIVGLMNTLQESSWISLLSGVETNLFVQPIVPIVQGLLI